MTHVYNLAHFICTVYFAHLTNLSEIRSMHVTTLLYVSILARTRIPARQLHASAC